MYGCVIDWNGRRIYSSFYRTAKEAIEYAERMPGILAVELAHSGQPPIWERGIHG